MDISTINTTCGGPFLLDTGAFLLELLDAPGGAYNLINGTVLAADTVTGIGPAVDSFVFNWANVSSSLDVSGSTDGMVALRMTLIRSTYASFDNIVIEASVDSVLSSIRENDTLTLTAFPVPCTDQLTIRGLPAKPHAATLISTLGRVERTVQISAQGKLDVNGLASGASVVRMGEGLETRTVRFIKE